MSKDEQERAWENADILQDYDPKEWRSDYLKCPIRFADYENEESVYGSNIENAMGRSALCQ